MQVVVVPGFGGSGEAHWQTLWERSDPSFHRIEPRDWLRPDLQEWIEATDAAIASCASPPLLIGHSLGCLLIAHWAASAGGSSVRGALLVAVPDPSLAAFPTEAAAFATVPQGPLAFPAIVVASVDDPFSRVGFARKQASAWGAELVVAGALGHINAESGLGEWTFGKRLLRALARRARA